MKYSDSQLFQTGFRRTLRFYMTAPAPCPYLEGRRERKAFTSLSISDSDGVHSMLSQAGFRRSQGIAYRPACPNCNACRSVRISVRDFKRTKRWRRILNRNTSVVARPVAPEASREQFQLIKSYLNTRHANGGMSEMTFRDYASMVTESPVTSFVVEYRDGPDETSPLIAAAISDIVRDGLSMVYSYFDASATSRSLGSFMILEHIQRAAEQGVPYVYLGYWIEGSTKMDYKRQFAPLEVLNGDQWELLDN
ncbi:MAG: arginyltransferase [Pseudomonadota bacterium]